MPRLCGATAVAPNIQLQNGRVMHQEVNGGQRQCEEFVQRARRFFLFWQPDRFLLQRQS